jgi:CPA2 family monovalent cation:H+ antiporter-2
MAAALDNIGAYSDALVVLGTAAVIVPVVRRLGLSPVLGYLGAGALLGPLGLGRLMEHAPWLLYWITVVDQKNVAAIAELGVVFLLFLIGMELSLERLITMRRLVFGLGSLQVLLSTAVIAGVLAMVGHSGAVSVIIGACLALSSTAIVLEVLSNQRRLSTTAGRTSFSILLAQDLAVIPLLLLVSMLAASGGSVLSGVALAIANAALAVGAIVIVGRLLLRPLFRLVSATGSSELFVAATLFVIVGTAVIAGSAKLSMALGAFVAGLLLSDSEFRKAIETTIEPFKDLLLGLFFFTVGMSIDLLVFVKQPLLLLACVIGLIAVKAALTAGLARLFRVPLLPAIETGLLLGPGGEFAFVVLAIAMERKLVASETGGFALVVTSISMALIPLLAIAVRRAAPRFQPPKPVDPELTVAPPVNGQARAIVVGHGRVGKVVCDLLDVHGVPYLATDRDPDAVVKERRRGREVYYGDAANPEFLKSCGLMAASALIVTIHDGAAIDQIVRVARELRSDLLIVSRARDATHARHLYTVGVTDAVPETIEASLQLSEAALVGLDVPTGPVIASIHDKRDEFRYMLQEAAGREDTHAIRPRTRAES